MWKRTSPVHWKLATGLLTATLLATVSACSQPTVEETDATLTPQTEAPVADISDEQITEAIQRKLRGAQGTDAENINVETEQGYVTLSGTVANIGVKDRTEAIAETIEGVIAVANEVEVQAAELEDPIITAQVLEALVRNPATERLEISVETNDGTVRLIGESDSWQEKQLATQVAKTVEGVQNVNNQIIVELDEPRSEAEIREEVQQALLWNSIVSQDNIDVAVSDNTVNLSGVVGSAYEKRIAIEEAYVLGVAEVDASSLEVEPAL